MTDPFGNMKNMVSQFQQFMGNPIQYMANQNIPDEYKNDPQGAIQYLMNSGKLTQQQYNWASNMAKKIQNNPMFNQLFK